MMEPTPALWVFAIALGLLVIARALTSRVATRRKLARQRAIQLPIRQIGEDRSEPAALQIGQLRQGLAAARQRTVQKGAGSAALASKRARDLERELDEATQSRFELPADGFADTMPAPQDTQRGGLLFW
jgi:hypothetical protein